MSDHFGFINLNKPAGWSSRQAVDRVKPLVKPAKIGHAGTLDPLATGVLVLCVGPATRLVPYVHELPKGYLAEFLLGCTSPTDDTEGDVTPLEGVRRLNREQIEAALPQFVGRVEQVPPNYSAVKIRGQRAYNLARRGKMPDIKPRTVEIDSLSVIDVSEDRLTLDIECGSGTYVRSIGRDLAASLGSGAVMCGLIRTRIGPFALHDAVAPEEVTQDSFETCLIPPQTGLVDMPQVTANADMLELLQRGRPCQCPIGHNLQEGTEVAILSEQGRLILIAHAIDSGATLQPRNVFAVKRGRL